MGSAGTVVVTGATGFLGSHLTERLGQEDLRVRILARDPAKAEPFRERIDAVAIGDITDRQALAEIMDGADTVFHLVSNFRSLSDPPAQYRSTNVDGTLAALEVAQEAGVERFVHCSTIGVHGDVRHTPADESSPYAPGDLYQETKMEAERACLERAANGGDMDTVVVRPCSIYGPGDLRMLKMFKMLARRTFLMLEPCEVNFHAVYVDDLVEGFVEAMRTPGISGEAFIIGGPRYVPLRDYIELAAEVVEAPPPKLKLPYRALDVAAGVCETVCAPLRVEPPLSRRRVRFFKNNRAFSIAKARERLGYVPKIDLNEGMQRTVGWYKEQGYLQ